MKRLSMLLTFALAGAAMAEDAHLAKARGPLLADLTSQLAKPIDLGDCMPRRTDGNRARELLVAIGKPAIPSLIQAVRGKNIWARLGATSALQELGAKEALPTLAAAYETTNEPTLKPNLLNAIAYVGGREATPILLSALNSCEEEERYSIIQLLGATQDPSVIPFLNAFLDDPLTKGGELSQNASSALEALSKLGLPAKEVLAKAAFSEKTPLRRRAISHVLYQRDRGFDPLIRAILASPAVRSGDVYFQSPQTSIVREGALTMLLSDDIDLQVHAMEAFAYEPPNADVSAALRRSCRIIAGVSRRNHLKVISALALFDAKRRGKAAKPAIREAIAWATGPGEYSLSQIGGLVRALTYGNTESIDEALLTKICASKKLEDEDYWSTPSEAASGIGEIGGAPLRRLRDSWKAGLISRDTYGAALSAIRDPQELPLLEEALSSGDQKLAASSASALAAIGANEPKAIALLLSLRGHPRMDWQLENLLLKAGHPQTVVTAAKGKLSLQFKSSLRVVSDALLNQLIGEASSIHRPAVAAELVRRKSPKGIPLFIASVIGMTGEEHVSAAYEALRRIPANEQIFRACLSAQSVSVRGIAFLRLKALLDGDPQAKAFAGDDFS